MIKLSCPQCKGTFALDDALAGKQFQCGRCALIIQVPEVEAAPAPLAPPTVTATLAAQPAAAAPAQRARHVPGRATAHAGAPAKGPQPRATSSPALLITLVAIGLGVLAIAGVVVVLLSSDFLSPRMARTETAMEHLVPDERFTTGKDERFTTGKDERFTTGKETRRTQIPVGLEKLQAQPANAAPLPMQPAPLQENRETIRLKGLVTRACLGGGGRFLLLAISDHIAVFDVNEARIVKELPARTPHFALAASREKFVIAYPGLGELERWSLLSWQKELTVQAPAQVRDLRMGHSSFGPLALVGDPGLALHLLDLETLTPLPFPHHEGFAGSQLPAGGVFLQSSADGRTYGMRNGVGGEPHTVSVIRLADKVHVQTAWPRASVVAPSPDGSVIYMASGVYDETLQQLKQPKDVGCFLPAAHGPYFMAVQQNTIFFYLQGEPEPFAKRPDIEGACGEMIAYGTNRDSLMHSERIHFIPAAKLLISIPAEKRNETANRLVLNRFDPEKALAESGKDYLFVGSTPPGYAVKGQQYRYPLVVKSSDDRVQVTVAAGPGAMQLKEGSELTWQVPATYPEKEAVVTLRVRSGSGREVLQSFKLTILAQTPSASEQ